MVDITDFMSYARSFQLYAVFHVRPKHSCINYLFLFFSFPEALKLKMYLWLVPYAIFLVVVPYFCLTTAWKDPGILPRHTNPLSTIKADNPDEYDESGKVTAKLIFHHLNDNFVLGKQITVDGELITLKYCHTCELFRPPRASHCHYCDNCVEEYDHHCPWLSNCIGKRNYRNFVLFVFTVGLAAIYTCIFISTFIIRSSGGAKTYTEMLTDSFASFTSGLVLFTLATGITLLGLFGYHMMLIGCDLTTAEHVKKSKARVFTWETCSANFYRVFFHPVPDVQIPWDQYTHRAKPYSDMRV